MSNLCWLSEDQMVRPRPYFPKSHSVIPKRKSRDELVKCDKLRYKRPNWIEIICGCLNEWHSQI